MGESSWFYSTWLIQQHCCLLYPLSNLLPSNQRGRLGNVATSQWVLASYLLYKCPWKRHYYTFSPLLNYKKRNLTWENTCQFIPLLQHVSHPYISPMIEPLYCNNTFCRIIFSFKLVLVCDQVLIEPLWKWISGQLTYWTHWLQWFLCSGQGWLDWMSFVGPFINRISKFWQIIQVL
jgi:hypothetical protein